MLVNLMRVVETSAGFWQEKRVQLESKYAALVDQGAELVIWPECAWPYVFDRSLQGDFPSGHPWELRGGAKCVLLFGSLTQEAGVGTASRYFRHESSNEWAWGCLSMCVEKTN